MREWVGRIGTIPQLIFTFFIQTALMLLHVLGFLPRCRIRHALPVGLRVTEQVKPIPFMPVSAKAFGINGPPLGSLPLKVR